MVYHTERLRLCTARCPRGSASRGSICILVPSTYPADGHLVGGERAGLIGADDRRAAERLDGRQTAHDRVLLGHAARAERQAGRDDRRQALGDRGHRQRHRDLEVVDGALEQRLLGSTITATQGANKRRTT